ncbi:hypothetical protein BpOF4_17055 [Alkalihalophilus pseudofirmus OF4]|uniref:DUF5666 domain-containing protein n=1 Tax=Alkalihalophilus pseudofirmus (strain ATCC BAA-2126 / JCM 17055 / OF4) TaxID=398511 RepID=D3FQT4_ALKPO|nr:hypothetical protein [Alkalihalophilus pseudofirmus]ADC51454.1 hypothetical protein BpOF4_17055 [Alkalihalophilus pseudofirmus OF4]
MYNTLIVLTSCLLAAFSNEDQMQNAAFTGMIESIHNDRAIFVIEEGEILSSGDKVSVNLSVNEEDTFAVGDRVVVEYEGAVMESRKSS